SCPHRTYPARDSLRSPGGIDVCCAARASRGFSLAGRSARRFRSSGQIFQHLSVARRGRDACRHAHLRQRLPAQPAGLHGRRGLSILRAPSPHPAALAQELTRYTSEITPYAVVDRSGSSSVRTIFPAMSVVSRRMEPVPSTRAKGSEREISRAVTRASIRLP